jgi:hypothetical protein
MKRKNVGLKGPACSATGLLMDAEFPLSSLMGKGGGGPRNPAYSALING